MLRYCKHRNTVLKAATLVLAGIVLSLLAVEQALASPCRNNFWQPTFVHDVRPGAPDPGPYYVMPGGGFVRLPEGNYVGNACALIARYGLRDRRGFTNCQAYTRVQCGCDEASRANATCNRFLSQRSQTQQGNNSLASSLLGKWDFGRTVYGNRPVNQRLCNVTLTNQFVRGLGYRINSCHGNESYWSLEGQQLVFRAADGRVSTRFNRDASGNWEGAFVLDPNAGVRHYLRR